MTDQIIDNMLNKIRTDISHVTNNSKLAKQYGLKLFAMKVEQVYKVPECQQIKNQLLHCFMPSTAIPHERSISRVLKYVEGKWWRII